jgi:hypothetical protein
MTLWAWPKCGETRDENEALTRWNLRGDKTIRISREDSA